MFRYTISSDDTYVIDHIEVYKNQVTEKNIIKTELIEWDKAVGEWKKISDAVNKKYMESFIEKEERHSTITQNLAQTEANYANKTILFNGATFSTLMPWQAQELLNVCKSFEDEPIYNILGDSWRFPLYNKNAFFLVAEDDVELDSLSLNYSTDEHPDIFILGFIFKKNLTAKKYIIGMDIDNSPALIVLGNVISGSIHLFGNIHYIAGNTSASTIWCKYNHGVLLLKGITNTQLLLEDDMENYIGDINADVVIIGSRIKKKYLVSYADGSQNNMEVAILPTHTLNYAIDNALLDENYELIEEGENMAIARILENDSFIDADKTKSSYADFEKYLENFVPFLLEKPEMKKNNQLVLQDDYETNWIMRITEERPYLSIGYRIITSNTIIAAITYQEGTTNYELTLSYDQDETTNVAKMSITNTINSTCIEANMVKLAVIKTIDKLMDNL